jgi:UDP-N-acetyl-alpha-D-muramoyl-L-alanyl-L-glutamate epimerase
MPKNNNQEKFRRLREEYPFMAFDGFDYQYSDKGLRVQFHFSLSNKFVFHPTLTIPAKDFFKPENIRDAFLENLLFQIGMVESISYWKATCSPKLIIRGRSLSQDQVKWWKKLYFKGLGEFRFLNSIDVDAEDFIQIESDPGEPFPIFQPVLENVAIMPVGGGKDSVVTLEILGTSNGNIPLILNPRDASKGTVMKMGLYYDSIVEVYRTIDPVLLDLNLKGFLNGHTPFSALLGFVSVLSAVMTGGKYIILSNESSANEPTIQGSQVNHQYSKSIEFEEDLRYYLKTYISPDIEYFSFLRPLNELQIASLFAGFPNYFDVFKSCNVGSRTDSWCGKCAKCLFTYIILSPFLPSEKLESIFGKNLFQDETLWPLLEELAGIAITKPFDCIGTVDEVNAALQMTLASSGDEDLPVLLKLYKGSKMYSRYLNFDIGSLLHGFNGNHFLPRQYENLLRSKIHA